MIIAASLIWLLAGCLTGWFLRRHYGEEHHVRPIPKPTPAAKISDGPKMAPPYWML